MPGQKRKYNVRFPPGRIKKIMQKDTEVGRIAMAVPVIIARALEMFLKSLLTKTCLITQAKFNNIVSVAHMKQCIESEKLFHFLKDLAEGATSTATQKDNRGLSVWPPIHRSRSSTSAYNVAFPAAHLFCSHVIRLWSDSTKQNKTKQKNRQKLCSQ
ncbi:dr1-associated corepressor-like isoform X2 [Poecilia formosa]|uniref:dr1-associated corepressor-like isoform X2 n=1 Tax=Poecilia formosa TaxID=48698 RepID=UPI0007B7A96D|nr:PREDICTED: dr1-associated corepressor-like isoform X2 [Poecilia formosa]